MVAGKFMISKIAEQKAFGADSGTETITLPTSNYLQGLNIRIQNTNGSTSNSATTQTIATCITKIEVVADGIPMYSVTGEMARMIEQPDIGMLPPYDERQTASGVQYACFPIKFGRDKYDKNVILPAHRFHTLQLKITYAFTDSTTVGFTTSETNAKYDVLANYLVSRERKNTPVLKKLEIYSKTLNTIQVEEVVIPVGAGNGAYRRVFLRAYEAAIEDGVDVDKYEVLVNDSQRIVDERWATSQFEDMMRYGVTTRKALIAFLKDNDTIATKVSRIKCPMSQSGADKHHAGFDVIAGDTLTANVWDLATPTAISTEENVYLEAIGEGIAFGTVIDFGTDDIRDSIDVSDSAVVSSLKLRLNVAAAGAEVKVVTEQLVEP